MDIITYNKISNDPLLHKFIREYSYWYKIINRNPLMISEMKKDMKDKYKLNFSDKVERYANGLSLINNLIETLK